MTAVALRVGGLLILMSLAGALHASEPAWNHVGLLRARDLTPFGLLRLDMPPAHTVDSRYDSWAFEVQTAYQNTFVLSDNVRDYLETRGVGRTPLRAQDADAILALPGDAYYVDGELGLIDFVIHRRLSQWWSAYLSVSFLSYGNGALDSTIESFHDLVGFSQQGRDLVARNQFQFVYDVGGVQAALLDGLPSDGFGDPVLGLRYSLPEPRYGWDVVFEVAAKIAVDGERYLLSTGGNDYGAQLTLQRRWGRHAAYLAGSGVYYDGGFETPANESQIIPTVIAGYGFGLTPSTSVILQAYASRSVVRNTDIEELSANKYQLSLGVQQRLRHVIWSFAVTENISNFGNTPDVGVQLGIAYLPGAQ